MNQETPKVPAKRAKKTNVLFRIVALAVTAALVLGALVLVVHRDRYNLDALKRWLSYRSLTTSETGEGEPFPYSGGSSQSLEYIGDGVLFASNAGAHYYSLSGDLYKEEIVNLSNPVLSASEHAGVVYDAGGQSLLFFQNGAKTFSLDLEGGGDLLSARVNDAGWLAVTAQESGYKGSVTVYNSDYEKVINISLSSTFLVDAAVSPDCKTVAVVTMGQSGGSFQSQLLLYPTNAQEPSATLSLGSMTVLDLEYEQNQIWLLSDSALVVADAKGQSSAVYSFGRDYLKGCALDGDGFALLLLGRYRAGTASQMVVIGPDGALTATRNLTGQVLSFDAAGRYLALLTGDNLTIYTPDLNPYATLESAQNARYTALTPNGTAILADQQKVWLFRP